MKKGNLFLTLVFIAMAVLVGVGSMFATFAQAQSVALQVAAASDSTKLFDNSGKYAVEYNTLKNSKGQIFNFFGQDWYLVNFNDEAEVATFWMVEPYGNKYAFGGPKKAATTKNDLFWQGKTLWCNGYSKTVWNNETIVGDSDLKIAMREIANTMIKNSSHKYKDKVLPGFYEGSNMNHQGEAGLAISHVYHAEEGVTSLYEITSPAQSMVAYDTLDSTDYLWVPSAEEVKDGGLWKLSNTERNWSDTTVDSVVWLRSAVDDNSSMAQLIGYDDTLDRVNVSQDQSFFKTNIDQKHGVRPAIHLSLKNYGDGNGNNGGWFTDDMMKVFFIIICVLGIIGVILVIIAVVAKARRDKANEEQNA